MEVSWELYGQMDKRGQERWGEAESESQTKAPALCPCRAGFTPGQLVLKGPIKRM